MTHVFTYLVWENFSSFRLLILHFPWRGVNKPPLVKVLGLTIRPICYVAICHILENQSLEQGMLKIITITTSDVFAVE